MVLTIMTCFFPLKLNLLVCIITIWVAWFTTKLKRQQEKMTSAGQLQLIFLEYKFENQQSPVYVVNWHF